MGMAQSSTQAVKYTLAHSTAAAVKDLGGWSMHVGMSMKDNGETACIMGQAPASLPVETCSKVPSSKDYARALESCCDLPRWNSPATQPRHCLFATLAMPKHCLQAGNRGHDLDKQMDELRLVPRSWYYVG